MYILQSIPPLGDLVGQKIVKRCSIGTWGGGGGERGYSKARLNGAFFLCAQYFQLDWEE